MDTPHDALPCMEKPRSKATASVISRNNYPMVFLEQLLNLIDDFGKERKLFLNELKSLLAPIK